MDNTPIPITRAKIGQETARQNPYAGLEEKLNNELSLAEGLRQQRMGYASGKGQEIVSALQNPENRAPGQSPVQGLNLGMSLKDSYVQDISNAGSRADNLIQMLINIADKKKQADLDEQNAIMKRAEAKQTAIKAYKDTGVWVDPSTGEIGTVPDSLSVLKINKTGVDAISEVAKQGGESILKKYKTVAERSAIAEDILKSGGWDEYRKQVPLESLTTEDEDNELRTTTNLLVTMDRALGALPTGDEIGGTGPIAGLINENFVSDKTKEMRRAVTDVEKTFLQLISGKVISDKEVARLHDILPKANKTESANVRDIQRLREGINFGIKLFELGKREGLTANQAYDKYGKDLADEMGVNIGQDNKKDNKSADDIFDAYLGGK
jgi:hypothetical protein